MELITHTIAKEIEKKIIHEIKNKNYSKVSENIANILDKIYQNIPDNKRISYGRYYTIKILSKSLFDKLHNHDSIFDSTKCILNETVEYRVRGVCLSILSEYGKNNVSSMKKVIPIFKTYAIDNHWEARENAAGFFQQLIMKYPSEIKPYLKKYSKSANPFLRRFVSESLRPVTYNKWIQQKPQYSISILKNMFKEPVAYPRTSVGNNLSDLSRKNPELIFDIVKDLVESEDKNSYWIAYRACRNLVKKEPIRVMNLLRTDEYKYKNNSYKRSDFE